MAENSGHGRANWPDARPTSCTAYTAKNIDARRCKSNVCVVLLSDMLSVELEGLFVGFLPQPYVGRVLTTLHIPRLQLLTRKNE
jgi:hypothetical protein